MTQCSIQFGEDNYVVCSDNGYYIVMHDKRADGVRLVTSSSLPGYLVDDQVLPHRHCNASPVRGLSFTAVYYIIYQILRLDLARPRG